MRTDGRTDGKLIVAFHNFAKAPKNQLVSTDARYVLSLLPSILRRKFFFFFNFI